MEESNKNFVGSVAVTMLYNLLLAPYRYKTTFVLAHSVVLHLNDANSRL